MDGWKDPATEAALSLVIEPSIDLTLHESRDAKLSDSSPACARVYRIQLGADPGVHLRGYLSTLALR